MPDIAVFSSFHRVRRVAAEPGPSLTGNPVSRSTVGVISQPTPNSAGVEDRLDQTATSVPLSLPRNGALQGNQGENWARISAILDCDQLGLVSPNVISLSAQLLGCAPVPLEANPAGIYRPTNLRPSPWGSFAYDLSSKNFSGVAAGTRILTARGEVEVERLVPGDAAMALRSPALLPISWIGHSMAAVRPIRIESCALGPNLPRRPLCVGPDQAIFLEPVPVTARTLINGTTVREADSAGSDMFHVDVGRIEVILAEGVPLSSSHRANLQLR